MTFIKTNTIFNYKVVQLRQLIKNTLRMSALDTGHQHSPQLTRLQPALPLTRDYVTPTLLPDNPSHCSNSTGFDWNQEQDRALETSIFNKPVLDNTTFY